MIAFAVCVGSPEKFAAHAVPGLRRALEPDSQLAELTADAGSIHAAYNEALEHFAALPDLEALVLMHEDVEILDAGFGGLVRAALADQSVAIAGPVGARGVSGLAWWEGEIAGHVSETRGVVAGGFERADVDALDGLMLVLSPWAVRELRFDETSYGGFHGYDVDICFQARSAGRRVVVAPLPVHHHTKGGYGDTEAWLRSDAAFRAKWHPAPHVW